ncbi:uncharacterized protein EAF02_003592 [Botrytis sinoallii]|uniref:uncharacterized protein n=1 Tax=Botrytis sinoallii TaxID=1463999 RepID=UPI0019012CF6|nr:uncharacterized protein EAF02_003592 [Botrytis sinoallii]KAF7886945.1 hypothetical protein EAF02_003592 [Botrytis sinoallii]
MFEAHAYLLTLFPKTRPMKRHRRNYHASPQRYDSTWITNPFFKKDPSYSIQLILAAGRTDMMIKLSYTKGT